MIKYIARMIRNGTPITSLIRTFVFEDSQATMVIYPSYTGLIYNMLREGIGSFELDNGLFAFGCTRTYVIDQTNDIVKEAQNYVDKLVRKDLQNTEDYIESLKNLNKIQSASLAIREAVIKAEKEGRIVWRLKEDGNMSYSKVSDLLAKNYQPLLSDSENFSYNYPRLRELTSLKVIY
jgi:hypothetical protein